MRFWTVVLLSALALAGCNKPRDTATAQDAALVQTEQIRPPPKDAKAPPPSSPAVSVAMLAYTYGYDLVAPAKALPDLQAQHQKLCTDAGPALCQVVGASLSQGDGGSVVGKLTIQARPDWLAAFRGRLAGDAKAAGGRIADSRVTSEDLTRQIVDTEAAVRARMALRDRLQAILATRPGKLSDLLEVEKELARVQGELDATQSELAVMRTRVATSLLTITYGSGPSLAAPHGAWAPLAEAVRGSANALATTLGFMITIVVVLAPWAIAAGVIFLVVRRFTPKKPKPPAKA
jgi:hypothetical protein